MPTEALRPIFCLMVSLYLASNQGRTIDGKRSEHMPTWRTMWPEVRVSAILSSRNGERGPTMPSHPWQEDCALSPPGCVPEVSGYMGRFYNIEWIWTVVAQSLSQLAPRWTKSRPVGMARREACPPGPPRLQSSSSLEIRTCMLRTCTQSGLCSNLHPHVRARTEDRQPNIPNSCRNGTGAEHCTLCNVHARPSGPEHCTMCTVRLGGFREASEPRLRNIAYVYHHHSGEAGGWGERVGVEDDGMLEQRAATSCGARKRTRAHSCSKPDC